MKKCRKNIYCILLTVIMMCTAVFSGSVTTNAARSKNAQHKLYSNTMKKYAKKAQESCRKNSIGSVDTSRKVMYVFVDIDKNGIDELIMRYADPAYNRDTAKGSGYGESTSIYTIKNGKVYTVLDNSNIAPGLHSNFVRIYKNRSRINMGFSHGYWDDLFCKYSNGKIETKKNKIWLTCTYLGSRNATCNGKSISYSTYISKYKTLTNKEKGYIMKIYK